tara:strand:- start:17934 stop:18800 length:867 start_codon:yes stop_codon:yes gene_type:complete
MEIVKQSYLIKKIIYDLLTDHHCDKNSRFILMFQLYKDNLEVYHYLSILKRRFMDKINHSNEMCRQFDEIKAYFGGLPDVKLCSEDFITQAKMQFDKLLREEHQRYEGIYLMLKNYPYTINLGTSDIFVNRFVPVLRKVMKSLDNDEVVEKTLNVSSMTIEDVMEVIILTEMAQEDKTVIKKIRELMVANNIAIESFDKHFPPEKSTEDQIADVIAKMKQLCVAKDFKQLSCLGQELTKLMGDADKEKPKEEPKETVASLIDEVEKMTTSYTNPQIKKIITILKKMNE